ncbi:hypothetical protein GTY86_35760 [Streptomyces sp. SID5770]|uniref:hypothetical protein n=1 Tax=Streptomyces sp. SID5770 TaxID=2690308 RepID=UPI00136FCFBF|nr:hypothetical protein [Streptomyces sp. SID5770]MZE53779.1 hypothetical protein [Streptomyces sp. SID5770]MZE56532.1 hypothetical protein [Streptomyces sp. SID5770]
MPRGTRRPAAQHTLRADDCRRHPGTWIEISVYVSSQSAKTVGRHIVRANPLPQYGPPGAFETRTRLVDDGALLEARYLGGAR